MLTPLPAKNGLRAEARFLMGLTSKLQSCAGASECLHLSGRVYVGNLRSEIYFGRLDLQCGNFPEYKKDSAEVDEKLEYNKCPL